MNDNLRRLEKSFAYEYATSPIEVECSSVQPDGIDGESYFDLSFSDVNLTEQVAYLESRGLLQHHPHKSDYVLLLDESEEKEELNSSGQRKPPASVTAAGDELND